METATYLSAVMSIAFIFRTQPRGAKTAIPPLLPPQHALIGFTPTPTHQSALQTCARPYLLSRHRPHAQRSRAHFTPQHWLLCLLGLC
jgi:hypothetical protein